MKVIRTNLLVDAQEAAREPVEEYVEVVSLVDLAPRPAALTVCHQRGG